MNPGDVRDDRCQVALACAVDVGCAGDHNVLPLATPLFALAVIALDTPAHTAHRSGHAGGHGHGHASICPAHVRLHKPRRRHDGRVIVDELTVKVLRNRLVVKFSHISNRVPECIL